MDNDRMKFMQGLDKLAMRCNFEMSEWDLEAYLFAFQEIGFAQGIEALKRAFFKVRGNAQMPAPMDLLEMVGVLPAEPPKAKDQANQIASSIINAISKFGSYQALKAKEAIGDEAWAVVEGFGGWAIVCEIEIDQLQTFRAQLRDLAESKTKIAAHAMLIGGKDQNFINGLVEDLASSKDLNRNALPRLNSANLRGV